MNEQCCVELELCCTEEIATIEETEGLCLLPLPNKAEACDILAGKAVYEEDGRVVEGTLETYAGDTAVTPTVEGSTMPTKGKYMAQDVTINPIPFYNVSNTAGGTTVYIAKEI